MPDPVNIPDRILVLTSEWNKTQDEVDQLTTLLNAAICADRENNAHLHEEVTRLRAENERLAAALEDLVGLQAHYAKLLNGWDGGERIAFKNAAEYLARRDERDARLAALAAHKENSVTEKI